MCVLVIRSYFYFSIVVAEIAIPKQKRIPPNHRALLIAHFLLASFSRIVSMASPTSIPKLQLPRYGTYPLPTKALKIMAAPGIYDSDICRIVNELQPEEVMAIAAASLRKVEDYVPLFDAHPHRDIILMACGKRWREMGGEMPDMLCVLSGEPPSKKPKIETKERPLGPRNLLSAIHYAARRHDGQHRKNKNASPYINHPIQVCDFLAGALPTDDPDYYPIMMAGILHDTIEDCNHDDKVPEEIKTAFGKQVLDLVLEVTDDKSLSDVERKRAQVTNAPHKSTGAALIKLADKLSNLSNLDTDPPVNWTPERIVGSVHWTLAVVEGLPKHPTGADVQLRQMIIECAGRVLRAHDRELDDRLFYDLERDYYLPFFSQ